ncbi:hypothetical protein Leryth_016098 [Lithospermum erythrorhizon]|nr:hypothetical protein Leryth_016098 [Lithospermum erythrorhizon]
MSAYFDWFFIVLLAYYIDEGRSKRVKSSKDEEAKKVKNDEKKHKSHKSSSSKRHSDKEKKSKDKRKVKKHKHGDDMKLKIQELSGDDYFAKNNEFSTWLKEEKDIFFSDLSSESAHELFAKFVKAWNNQKLESRYYEGISTGPRTAHLWNIRK